MQGQLPVVFERGEEAREQGQGQTGEQGTGRAGPASPEAHGLGLATSKGLVEAHGGRIRAASGGAGLGVRFTFTIPVAGNAAPETSPSGDPPGAPGRGRAKMPILVVDDETETLRYVRGTLSNSGYAPLVAGDPEEFVRVIRSERPSLVLLDLILPGTDGIKLMKQVPELAHVPVIFISAYGRDEMIAKALRAVRPTTS